MSEEYLKQRKKLRFNSIVASLFLFGAAALAVMYGASFLAVYWVLGNYAVALGSFVAALAVAVLCLGFWLKIITKMKAKLKAVESSVPSVAVSA
jgi:TRAP-type mannitol/chloroaromatic compound transport system permease small subunit